MEELSIRPREVVQREFVQDWIARAEEDLGSAKALLVHGTAFLRQVGFHAQQAAEKYLKAYLTRHQIEFPKTHNLGELLHLVARVDRALSSRLRVISELNPYAVDARYAASPRPSGLDAAEHAIELAEQVRDSVLAALSDFL